MLTKTEANALNKLIEREDVISKRQLRIFIYNNTVKPKYKVGDYVIFSDTSSKIYGVKVINFIGRVNEVLYTYDGKKSSTTDPELNFAYGLDVKCHLDDGTTYTAFECVRQIDISRKTTKMFNIVVKKNKTSQMMCL